MAIELNINGYFDMTIYDKEGVEVDLKTEAKILKKLQTGDYIIGLASREIYDLNDFQNPIYEFDFDPSDAVEYEFDKY